MNKEDLIKFAATEIMGWHTIDCGARLHYTTHERGVGYPVDKFNPLSDQGAYQLELIEVELVKLGFTVRYDNRPDVFRLKAYIKIKDNIVGVDYSTRVNDQIRLTKLKTFCDAWKKLKGNKNEH